MNFLAHIYLSGDNDNIKIGNFIADAIKGKNYLAYDKEIQKGILLHRSIDSFTDKHTLVRKSKERLHKRYKHYSGVIIDIFYDHYLAKNWSRYCDIPLNEYSHNFYELIRSSFHLLPERTQHMLPFMIRHNWLYNYRTLEGIEKVLVGMNRRTDYKSQMHLAIEDLKLNYESLDVDFTAFFKILRNFSKEKIQTLSQ